MRRGSMPATGDPGMWLSDPPHSQPVDHSLCGAHQSSVPPRLGVSDWRLPAQRYADRQPSSEPMSGEWQRSEEHTSELQSQSNLVCRLLLEKKKKKKKNNVKRKKNKKIKKI